MDTQKSKSAVLITVPTTQPVFLLGFHRGGTTFVQRILNCHRDVTVWGENRGVLTLLRQFYETYADSPAQPVEVDSYRRFTEYADQFVPWANPFSATDLIRDIAQFVESIYARGEAEYWGFKEIRHADVADISFLCRLFPKCRILLLVRHPKDNMQSEFLVRWTSARAEPSIDVYVRQFLNRYTSQLQAFRIAAEHWPSNTQLLTYESVRDGAQKSVFDTMKIPSEGIDEDLLATVFKTRTGSSFDDSRREDASEDDEQRLQDLFLELIDTDEFAPTRAVVGGLYPDINST